MPENASERRAAFETKLSAEAHAVLTSTAFRRSPVLSKLLRYLVDETIKGNGDALNSYAVAVDGSGRPETFDSASDSSARVQMVRLRKALESHYAQHGPVDELCLYLQPGTYKVRAGKMAHAYPQLYRPLSDLGKANAEVARNSATSLAGAIIAQPGAKSSGRTIIVGGLVGIALAMLAWTGWQQFYHARKMPHSPVLELLPVEHANNTSLNRTARIVSATFANDLPRFNIAQVRITGDVGPLRTSDTAEILYRLSSRIEDDASGTQHLFLRLTDASTGTAFWSYNTQFDGQPKSVADALIPLTADINGPFGVIAAQGSMLYRDRNDGGYACLLKYFSFVETRATEVEPEIAACLQKPVTEEKLRATVLAARALFAIERSAALANFDAAASSGLGFARAAVEAGPNDSSANFALARLSYITNDCVSANFYTRRAVEANANSPLIMANLAAVAPMCNYPNSAALLDRAFVAQSARYPRGRLLLTLAALQQGRPDKLAEIKPSAVPQSQFSRVNYYLTETLIASANGDRALTAQNWEKFVSTQSQKSRDPDKLLRPIIITRPLRQKLIRLLADAGAFDRAKKGGITPP